MFWDIFQPTSLLQLCESPGFGSNRSQKRCSVPSGRQKNSTYYFASAVPLPLLQPSACTCACVFVCMYVCVCLGVRPRRWTPPAHAAHALQVRPELRAPRCAALSSCVSERPRPEVRVSVRGGCSARVPAYWFGTGRAPSSCLSDLCRKVS